MRTHRVFPALQPWATLTAELRDLVNAAHLAAARIEPVTRGREPTAFVDLHFTDGERSVCVPLVYLDLAQFDVRELDPLLFPHELVAAVPDANVAGVVERLFPDLERRALTGGFRVEETIVYGDRAPLDAARARGFFGAAPLAETLPRVAAAVYGQRFAVGKHIATYGPDAIELAAFLRGFATSCTAVCDPDPAATRWFGAFAAAKPGTVFDLAIGTGPAPVEATVVVRLDAPSASDALAIGVAAPLPADRMLSFDPSDGPPVAQFWVQTAREPFTRDAVAIPFAPALGGSSGRIAIVLRADAGLVPDADTAEAATLAAGLRAEGFTVEAVTSLDALEAFAPDLVHLFGVLPGADARRAAEWASQNGKPLIVHAFYEQPAAGGYWGAMVSPYCFGYSGDDRNVGAYLEMLSRRAVEVDEVNAMRPFAPPLAGLEDAERVLTLADVVLVNSEREYQVVDRLRPRRPTFIVGGLAVSPADRAAPIGARIGTDPFVLVHAPVRPESNQLVLARAALNVGVPFVLAGCIADPAYAERLREFAPANLIVIDEPSAEEITALYRSATVMADAAWTARGHGRLLTAAAFGAAIVCSQARWIDFPAGASFSVDPADVNSVARGIGEAWDAALRRDGALQEGARYASERLGTACQAIVASYAKIAQTV